MHQKKEIDAGLSQVSQFPLEILCTSGQKCFSLAARALSTLVYLTSFVTKDAHAVDWAVFFVDGAPAAQQREKTLFYLEWSKQRECLFCVRHLSEITHCAWCTPASDSITITHTTGRKIPFPFLC
jgi:hypothetical protein